MKGYKKYKELNNDFFNRLISQSSNEHSSIGNSKESHEKRLKKVLEIGEMKNKKVLDVGCGVGSLLSYSIKQKIDLDYYGYDINEKMLIATREKFPSHAQKFQKVDIIEEEINEIFDYCISIGPLNLYLNEDVNYSLTFKLLDSMFKCSKIGFALSMTSILSKKKNRETFYYDPNRIIQHVAGYCNNFKLDHSFLPHDFVIFCYKNDFYNK